MMIDILSSVSKTMKHCGMAKGIRKDIHGHVCLLGGFDEVAKKLTDSCMGDCVFHQEIRAVVDTIKKSKKFAPRLLDFDEYNRVYPLKASGVDINIVAGFNNHKDTTLSDVLLVLRRTRARLKKREKKSP